MIPGLAQWVKGSSVASAVAQIQSLGWNFNIPRGGPLKKKKKVPWSELIPTSSQEFFSMVLGPTLWVLGNSSSHPSFFIKG